MILVCKMYIFQGIVELFVCGVLGYLGNVLQDLGHQLTESLEQLSFLLKLPADQYQAKSSGVSAKYVAAVRQMRNISSVG